MVTRESSFPQLHPPLSTAEGLAVDSADVPPIPFSPREGSAPLTAASYLDNDNPWNDQPSSQLQPDRPPPAFLKPRNGKPVDSPPEKQSLQPVPATLRPGLSGQDTPRSSVDSGESRDFWEDDEVPDRASPTRKSPNKDSMPPPPPSSTRSVKRKPVVAQLSPQPQPPGNSHSSDFASLNPFRRPSEAGSQQETSVQQPRQHLAHLSAENLEPTGKGKQPVRDPVDADGPSSQLSNLHLSHNQPAKQAVHDPWRPLEPTALPPPPPAQPERSPAPTAPQLDHKDHMPDPWASAPQLLPSASSFNQSQKHFAQYTDGMLDRGQDAGAVSLSDELQALPNINTRPHPESTEQPLLYDDDEIAPSLAHGPVNQLSEKHPDAYEPPSGAPPSRVPRPITTSTPLSEAEIAKNIEDRSETYQIKHFNWFDHSSGRLRSSSMLVQNKNGPCPLLALVNALILGAKEESQAALDDALRSREQVSIGLIIETLMYELITRGAESGAELPDVDALNAFLMRLKTGMNANPRFVANNPPPPNLMDAENSALDLPQAERQKQKAGSFESTLDMNLYGAFAVPLLHGWLPEPGTPAEGAFKRSAQTYEDAQALQFSEEELEYKLTTSGLSPQEQAIWEDINSIKTFLEQFPTQLTPSGLDAVRECLPSGSFAIMFRNDHFSTIYKHPQSGQLFTLITDAGYAERDEIIWESLVDISGAHNDYFSGDFRFVSHEQADSRNAGDSGAILDHHQHLSVPDVASPLSPQEQQEQHDADFAMALQLQEEEEQRERAASARRMRSGTQQGNQNRRSPRGSATNIPITLTPVPSRSDAPENRPAIPPRAGRGGAGPLAVNRPSDALEDDAPPAYEEAAKGKPYIPPVGSPLHPTYSSEPGASANASSTQLTGTTSNISRASNSGPAHPPGPNAPYSNAGPMEWIDARAIWSSARQESTR
ncbi:hypothetical protein DV736_g4777, partial [Chaetothyriales sp. CBS 134916]